MKLRDLIHTGKEKLRAAGLQVADPQLHMQQIVAGALGWESTQVYLQLDRDLTSFENQKIEAVLSRRLAGEPFQYILGYEWFWDAKFDVGPGCLIPRRETELIVEECLKLPWGEARVAELGAGSGNIGLSVGAERPGWKWFAFEKSPAAYAYAEKNQARLKVPGYHLEAADFFAAAGKQAPYDLIVSNPPYVTAEELKQVAIEVTHEPHLALSGGVDGLEIIRPLVSAASSWLKPGGRLLFEIGSGQGPAALALLSQWSSPMCLKDYAGLDRLIMATKAGQH